MSHPHQWSKDYNDDDDDDNDLYRALQRDR